MRSSFFYLLVAELLSCVILLRSRCLSSLVAPCLTVVTPKKTHRYIIDKMDHLHVLINFVTLFCRVMVYLSSVRAYPSISSFKYDSSASKDGTGFSQRPFFHVY